MNSIMVTRPNPPDVSVTDEIVFKPPSPLPTGDAKKE